MTSPEDVDKYLLKDGDVVISRAGSVGFSYLLNKPQRAVFASYLIRFRPLIESKYFAYFLKSPIYWKSISEKKLGIAVQNVNAVKLKEISIPIAPLNEQKRIVAKIEQLFSDLDAGVATLKAIKKQIRQYRQSVLKYAFEGKLTAEWRKKNKPEPASTLLEQITKERQQQSGGKKQKPLPPLDTSNLPELPEGWEWTRLGNVIEEPKYGTSKKCGYESGSTGVLRIPNIVNGAIDSTDLKYASFDENEQSTYKLRKGDLLTIRSNGSVSLVGKCALVTPADEQYLFAGYLIRLRPVHSGLDSNFLLHLMRSHFLRKQIESKAKSTSGVNNINSGEITSLIIPLCTQNEQNQIACEIERHFSIADKAEEIVNAALKQSEWLRQSILKQAFEGKLVPQDPTDEPAEKLLARIRQGQG
jgi:type I restriction enzyme S subunit